MNKAILFLMCVLLSTAGLCQEDIFPGTWQMNYKTSDKNDSVFLELKIGNPEKNLLYPAQLIIRSGVFIGNYNLLLVKKNRTELAISRNKSVISESPFSIGDMTLYLHHILRYGRLEGNNVLRNHRMPVNPVSKFNTESLDDANKPVADRIKKLLESQNIILRKINPFPWRSSNTSLILNPGDDYFGIMDTIHVNKNIATLTVADNKKNDSDTVSILFNGKPIVDPIDIRKKSPAEEIELEKGLNIITLFADNYGKLPYNKGRMIFSGSNKKLVFDFNNIRDAAATFIVAKVYFYNPVEDSIRRLSNYVTVNDPSLNRTAKPLGQMVTTSEQITLALWDDAVEDGDSITLKLNNEILVRGFPVKKRPQFIKVTLEPGPNEILFIADNLGSIVPNTSVLEIIDGSKRKSFMINTDMYRNNQISIFYDYNPDK